MSSPRRKPATTSPLTSFAGSFTRNVRTPAKSLNGPKSTPPKGWPTSVFVDATRCMIVGWQVASEMTVQTVLSALEVTRLRRGAFHGGLSSSCDRAHSDAGSQY
jgi:transposase InsO family protein